MAIKHSTTAHPNDIVASANWNASHTIDPDTIKTHHIDIDADLPFNNHKATGVKDPTANQDAATKKYVDDNLLLLVSPPIGSVTAWLKSYTNTPALPDGWVECNGQVLDDADSVYDGQTIPDLNGDARFLKGAATSGGTGGSSSHIHTGPSHVHTGPNHRHSFSVSDSGNTGYESDHDHSFSDTSTYEDGTIKFYQPGTEGFEPHHKHDVSGTTGSGSSHRHSFSMSDSGNTGYGGTGNTGAGGTGNTGSTSTLPIYYNVVWIMRVK